jgi:hypothetical protein
MWRRIAVILFIWIVYHAVALGGITRLSKYDRSHLLVKDTFQVLTSTARIPIDVKSTFAAACRERTFSMADPGQEYQETDVVEDTTLPIRRLLFAAKSADHFLIHYEIGGFAHSYHVLLFRLKDSVAQFVWGASCEGQPFHDMDELKSAISADKLDDRSPYLW